MRDGLLGSSEPNLEIVDSSSNLHIQMPPEISKNNNPMTTLEVQDDEEDTIEDDFAELSKRHDLNTSRGSLVMGAKGYRTDEEDKDDDCKTEKGNLF